MIYLQAAIVLPVAYYSGGIIGDLLRHWVDSRNGEEPNE